LHKRIMFVAQASRLLSFGNTLQDVRNHSTLKRSSKMESLLFQQTFDFSSEILVKWIYNCL